MSEIKSDTAKFLSRLREVTLLDGDNAKKEQESLSKEYAKIFRKFRMLSPERVLEELGISNQKEASAIVKHLFIGRNQVKDFFNGLTSIIKVDPDTTAWAIGRFITTHDAFIRVRDGENKQTPEEQEADRKLVQMMLGVDGADLSSDFVRKVKGELMLSLVGYAESRLCKRDLRMWKENKTLREQWKDDREGYLVSCIEKANRPLFYKIDQNPEGREIRIACAIREYGEGMISGENAPKQIADCAFVNHEEKIIVVGAATSNQAYDAKQLLSLTRFVVGLQGMTKEDGPFEGYQIRPLFFHSGYFSAAENAETGVGRKFVEELRVGEMPQEQIENLARCAIFNLIAEKHPSEQLGKVFSILNPHLAGCDTLPQYEASQEALKPQGRSSAIAVLQSLCDAVGAINHPAFNLNKSGDPRGAILEGTLHSLRSFYSFFPVAKGSKISDEEKAICKEISSKLQKLDDKLVNATWFGRADGLINGLANIFGGGLSQTIKRSGQSASHKAYLVYDDGYYHNLCQEKNIFNFDQEQMEQAAAHSVVEEIMAGKMPKLLDTAIKHCLDNETCLRKIEKRELQAIHEKLAELAEGAAKGYPQNPNMQSTASHLTNISWTQSLRNIRNRMDDESWKQNGTYYSELVRGTFDLAIATLQSTEDQIKGKKLSIALNRATPKFLSGCLAADDNKKLQHLAATHIIMNSASTPVQEGKKQHKMAGG